MFMFCAYVIFVVPILMSVFLRVIILSIYVFVVVPFDVCMFTCYLVLRVLA